jgi:hypothetical protein
MKVRSCWSALEKKAELLVKQLRSETGQTLRLLESLLASQLRIEQMYEEYRCKAVALTTETGMSAVQNHRQFMVQLQSLKARVDNDIGKTRQYLFVLEQRTIKAEAERLFLSRPGRRRLLACMRWFCMMSRMMP